MTEMNVIDAEVIDEPIDIGEPVALTPREQHILELRQLADLLESRPELPMPNYFGSSKWDPVTFHPKDAKTAANLVKALGGRWEKNDPKTDEYNASYLVMKALLGLEMHVRVVVSREGVCEKKVVGTTKKKVERVVVAEVTEQVYETVDVVEFECKSLMSLADQAVMAELEAVAS